MSSKHVNIGGMSFNPSAMVGWDLAKFREHYAGKLNKDAGEVWKELKKSIPKPPKAKAKKGAKK